MNQYLYTSTTLGDLINFSNGKSCSNRDENGKYAVFGANGEIGRVNESNTSANTIIIGRVGSYCGSVNFSKNRCWVTDNAIKAAVKLNNVPRFIFYILKNLGLNNWRSGSGQPLLNQSILNSIYVRIPSPPIQQIVSDFIEAIDDRIALLQETNTTLEAIAQALFKSWFIDFDPVHAKAEGRDPEGMDTETASLFPDSFDESELGLVPKGWKASTLGDIAKVIGKQVQTRELSSDVNYVGLEHMPRNSLGLFNWSTAEGLASAKSCFSSGDILFGKLRPYFHKVSIAPFDGVCSTDILVCQSKKTSFYGVVLMHLYSNSLINYASRLSNGAKMPRVNWKDLAEYPIVLPSEHIAEIYSASIHPLLDRMKINTWQAKTIGILRDTLLPRLISGQICLAEVEDLVSCL